MTRLLWSLPLGGTLALLAACGPTAEELRAMDTQRCAGFGFAPGTDGFANCLMSATQQREAEAAADRRAFQARQAQENQARQEREAAERARSDAEAQRRRDEAQRAMSSGPADIGIPQIQMPDLSRMNCTSSSSGNAGSLSCH
ncbi:hypothetical protein M0638_27320 [Roseomonas sp. NAR14]|uniref:Lipoprotein n=1 Tax=Roseomonas acroporae TaxID=2937791 RepID=A0A9X1YLA3_9PROT|nr:hypothetical protein [Roseomonas acroporae]MCK8788071.1 hypothetical protein [Roseomonas acroporae]